jgi:hypothetical protein
VRSRIESANAEGVNALSRSASSTTLPVSIADITEVDQFPPQYEMVSQRTYITALFSAIAR